MGKTQVLFVYFDSKINIVEKNVVEKKNYLVNKLNFSFFE